MGKDYRHEKTDLENFESGSSNLLKRRSNTGKKMFKKVKKSHGHKQSRWNFNDESGPTSFV